MKNEKLFNAIGMIEDKLIEEAETQEKNDHRVKFSQFKRYALPAAAIFVVCIGLYGVHSISFGGSGSASSADEFETAAVVAEEDACTECYDYDNSEEAPAESYNYNEDGSPELGSPLGISTESEIMKVPELFVNGVETYIGNWNCSIRLSGDEWRNDGEDGFSVLDCEGMLPEIIAEDTILLESGTDMTFTAYCYPAESFGSENADRYQVIIDNEKLILPDQENGWIVVVTGIWEEKDNYGNCEYFFEILPN